MENMDTNMDMDMDMGPTTPRGPMRIMPTLTTRAKPIRAQAQKTKEELGDKN